MPLPNFAWSNPSQKPSHPTNGRIEKPMRKFLLVPLLAAVISTGLVQALKAGPRDAQWKAVDEAISKGLPKTAITNLVPIIEGALKDKAYPEVVKAIARRITLEGNIQGNKPEEKILRLEAEIAKAPKEIVPVLDTVLANWYWHFFQQNRWRFMQRTQTAEAPGKDFTTWDLPRIMAEIDKQFTKALSAEKVLKTIPIATYNDLLQKGTLPDSYRPTMFDFLAHEALKFYSSGEQAGAKAEDAFVLLATSPIFAAADKFMAWKLDAITDTDSKQVKAIRLLQDLLRFHEKDADNTAFIDADLARLVYGQNTAFGEDKNKLYKAALKVSVDRWADHELSARALAYWASVLQQEGDLVEAHKLAKRGIGAHPNSIGGNMCFNIIQQIESKTSSIQTERVWNNPRPKIDVNYRNLTEVHFRVVAYDWNDMLVKRNRRPEWLDNNERKALLAKKAEFEWSAQLPPTPDYHGRVESLTSPEDIKPGSYYIISSHNKEFSEANNIVSFSDFWVSDLAIVMRTLHGEGRLEGFVLNAITGDPIDGAEISSWQRTNNNQLEALPARKTDESGLFKIEGVQQRGILVFAKHQNQQLSSQNEYWMYQNNYTQRPYDRTVFFTDRALYRPGQTVSYKGICIHVDSDKDDYQIVANRDLTVVFSDPNNKEITRQKVRSNDYGSFSGSFTAPRDRLMGRMSIFTQDGPAGSTAVNVEEYKRPKFQVALAAPKTAARLDDKVSLKGTATAYTGAVIDGAKVQWRVTRQVRYPAWWGWHYWWRPFPQSPSQEIAHGTAKTGTDGTFTIEFEAKPDLSVPEKDEPTFHYSINADVTDNTGETRSGSSSVNVGYTALQANLTATDWQTDEKAVSITLSTVTLDGEPQKAEGSLKVYKLKEPAKVERAKLGGNYNYNPQPRRGKGGILISPTPAADPSNVNSWELGAVAETKGWTTDATGKLVFNFKLAEGAYRVIVESQDRFGKKVTTRLPVQVLKPAANKLGIKIPHLLNAPDWSTEPGKEFMALWGSGYDRARAFIEIEHRGQILQKFWTRPADTQIAIKQAVTEAMRGGFTLHVTMVRENRAYINSHSVAVPWNNKNLTIKWEHFVSKLEPAQKETWTAVITGHDGKKSVAEVVAALYDKSLDAFAPHHFMGGFGVFRSDHSRRNSQFENSVKGLQHILGNFPSSYRDTSYSYRSFPQDIIGNYWGYQYFGRGGGMGGGPGGALRKGDGFPEASAAMAPGMAMEMQQNGAQNRSDAKSAGSEKRRALSDKQSDGERENSGGGGGNAPDLGKVSARKNLNETAFFFPHLISDTNGVVKMQFTMPEALTEWKFMGFSHDKNLRGGLLQDSVVTAKEIMVQPNPPRFLREGDQLEFTVKVSNQSAGRQTGKVALQLAEAFNNGSADKALGNTSPTIAFDVPSKESRTYSWRLKVPDETGFLTYKAVASTGRLSDGEEGHLPVLSRRILVTESLPLPIRGKQTKQFDFLKLSQSANSKTLKHQNMSVQMVSQPAWYGIMALPYLMEYPHECSEQIFSRLYANALARHIANSDPKIRHVFDLWKGTPALDSPLEKNQDLKSVMLEETPWLRQAQAESQARKNVGILFDGNRLNDETTRNLQKLAQMQLGDGAWPWFPGGPANDYITLYITTGFGRMRHLGVDVPVDSAVKSIARLDGWIDKTYRDILRYSKDKDANHLSPTIALYLYGRSFFLKDKPVAAPHKEAVDYFIGQSKKYWLQLANRQSQAHIAVALKRFGDLETPKGIMASIKERSVSNEEMGMFWRDLELSWWWYRAPIETQAMMIEAFDEVMGDSVAVEDCKVWLLKQKQTQDWKTTKATADAIYGLLLRGNNLLASDALVEVALAGQTIKPAQVEAGTGFYEKRFSPIDIKSTMGKITVKKVDEGVSWGSVHWQYFEDMSKVTPHDGTPLKLKKTLFTKVNTKKGPVLEAVKNGLVNVGDELVVRIELRTDRDMEYVHLKDQRGSGTEPVNVLSRYRYQDGLGYYETTRDTASHYFMDYLAKGIYVFEYSVRVQHRGQYQTGIAEIQSMYAPEFNSHSESFNLTVK